MSTPYSAPEPKSLSCSRVGTGSAGPGAMEQVMCCSLYKQQQGGSASVTASKLTGQYQPRIRCFELKDQRHVS